MNIKINELKDVETFVDLLAKNNVKYSIAYTYDTRKNMLYISGAIITIIGEDKNENKKN